MKDENLKDQVNSIIRDEIQEVINEYIESSEGIEESGLGFVKKEEEKLKVNISNAEVDKLIREYKKIKKRKKSNLNQIRLLDRHGKPLK
jgi:hypothetical protein